MLKIRRLVNRWSFSVLFLFSVIKILQFLKLFGIKGKEDGWRKATQAYLRTEHSKFVLAAFGLNLGEPEEDKIIRKLISFFKQQPLFNCQIKCSRFSSRCADKSFVDFAQAEFTSAGKMKSLVPYLDETSPIGLGDEFKNEIISKIIESYNQTKELGDKQRPLTLKKILYKWLYGYSACPRRFSELYLDRMLSANFITFEKTQEADECMRFVIPDFIRYKHPGFGLANMICRRNKNDEIDLWVQYHHTAVDGIPMQNILQQLKHKYGVASRIEFPADLYQSNSQPVLVSTKDGKNGIYSTSRLVNFFPLFRIENALNRKYRLENKRGVTLLRLVIWKLGNHPAFKDTKFLIPVDIRSRYSRRRSLGFVVIRPSFYFAPKKPENGFLDFNQEFNRQVKETIFRRSETFELLDRYAIFPEFIYSLTLKLFPGAMKELVGSFGVTVLNQAEAFVAPYSDVHSDGFIALSNITMRPKQRLASCYINIKASKDNIKKYIGAIDEISRSGFKIICPC